MYIIKKPSTTKFSKFSIDLLKSFKENITENEQILDGSTNLGKTSLNLVYDSTMHENSGINELVLPPEESHSSVYSKKLNYDGLLTFKKVWRYKYYSTFNGGYEYILLVYASDNKIYFNDIFMYNANLYPVGNFTFDEEPTLLSFRLNGADCVGFATSTNDLVVWNCDSNPYSVSTAPKFRSICFSNNKMFAIEDGTNYVVRYSSNLDPTSWTSVDDNTGGRIDLDDFRGELRKVVSHLDNVYVFRDFGISKITSYSSGSKFLASNVLNLSTKIYSNTICSCNSDICFLTEDGLYKFDGYKATKLDLSIFKNFKNYLQSAAQTCFYNGKLYVACYINFTSTTPQSVQNNCVIVVDLNTLKFSVINEVSVCNMFALKDLDMSKLIFCLNGENGKKLWQLCEGKDSDFTFNKQWTSHKFFGENLGIKTLKGLEIVSKNAITVSIKNDKNKLKTISILGSEEKQNIKVNLRGEYFTVNVLSTQSTLNISHFKLNFIY